jgi:hypothetical protein
VLQIELIASLWQREAERLVEARPPENAARSRLLRAWLATGKRDGVGNSVFVTEAKDVSVGLV